MKKLLFIFIANFILLTANAQVVRDIKAGIGLAFMGTGDKFIYKVEGEHTWRWNRVVSNSLALGLGYGDIGPKYEPAYIDQGIVYRQERVANPSFIAQVDANGFVSPFGNRGPYNLKIGTGASLLYAAEETYGFAPQVTQRVSVGFNMIVEQEVSIRGKFLLGLKAMMQPYFNGDINSSLLLKVGRKL